jgi:signal recognition particle receptor subunit beta
MQKLAGSSLLIFANKQDISGALTQEEIQKVRVCPVGRSRQKLR